MFVVFGRGKEYDQFLNRIKEEKISNILLFPTLPQNRVPEVYSLGNINLIINKKGVGKSALPSKLWSILACNSRIVASFDTDSDLAKVIEEAEAGVCVEAENSVLLSEAILQEYSLNRENNTENTSREYVKRNASKKECVKQYIDVIKKMVL